MSLRKLYDTTQNLLPAIEKEMSELDIENADEHELYNELGEAYDLINKADYVLSKINSK